MVLYSLQEAREATSLGKTKFAELTQRGEIRTVAVGRRRLVTRDALAEFVQKLEASTSGYAG
jgi:excisionase family DNA binding protein